MIVEERMRAYINSLDRGHTPFLEELAREAAEGRVPVIRREMQSFFKSISDDTETAENPGGWHSHWIFGGLYGGIRSGGLPDHYH